LRNLFCPLARNHPEGEEASSDVPPHRGSGSGSDGVYPADEAVLERNA